MALWIVVLSLFVVAIGWLSWLTQVVIDRDRDGAWYSGQFATKYDLRALDKLIMATQAELATDLRIVLAQQKKTAGEIAALQLASVILKTKVAELEAALLSGSSQELADAVAAVKAQAQAIDDQIPDVAVSEPPTDPPS